MLAVTAFGAWSPFILELHSRDVGAERTVRARAFAAVGVGLGFGVKVLHGPNHPSHKGTSYIKAAVEQLRSEGEPVELVLVQGLPGDEARRYYEEADVVDQLLIGAYAQFAIECMGLGKPVVCYLNPRFGKHYPEWAEAPIVSATPDTILDELRRLVRDRPLREALGARGPEYVRRYHSLEAVGSELEAVYQRVWQKR